MLEFVKDYGTELWILWGAVITIASVIVKLTPTKKDDKIFQVFYKLINALALNPNEKETKKRVLEDIEKEQEELRSELNRKDNDTTTSNLIDKLR